MTAANGAIISTVKTGAGPWGVAYDAPAGAGYVTNSEAHTVTVF
jgi:hypothetical protein